MINKGSKMVILLAMIIPMSVSGQMVPCELDPFCDDPDGPIEVPLDDHIWYLVACGAAIGYLKINKKKPGRSDRVTQ